MLIAGTCLIATVFYNAYFLSLELFYYLHSPSRLLPNERWISFFKCISIAINLQIYYLNSLSRMYLFRGRSHGRDNLLYYMTANVNSAAMKLRSRQNSFSFKCIKFHNLLINKIITIKILNFSSFIKKSIRINILLTRLSRSSYKEHLLNFFFLGNRRH